MEVLEAVPGRGVALRLDAVGVGEGARDDEAVEVALRRDGHGGPRALVGALVVAAERGGEGDEQQQGHGGGLHRGSGG